MFLRENKGFKRFKRWFFGVSWVLKKHLLNHLNSLFSLEHMILSVLRENKHFKLF